MSIEGISSDYDSIGIITGLPMSFNRIIPARTHSLFAAKKIKSSPMGFSTTAIHAGNEPDPVTGAVSVPIYQTSTYKQEALGKPTGGYEYARTQNPTRSALEKNIAALEGAKFGFAFASGMSAIDTTLKLVKAGDHVILGDNTYGGTFRLFNRILVDYGVEFDLADT